jgi:hypothetical protein
MFCPKCGTQNPETGRFCRSCGSDLGGISGALTPSPRQVLDRKGKPISWESVISKMGTGLAFIVIAFILGATHMGAGWWFWLLIPGFGSLGAGIAQLIQMKEASKSGAGVIAPQQVSLPQQPEVALPPAQTNWAPVESKYKTGDLVPPSVTDATTRHLELDPEGKTMTLPKK